MRLIAIFILGLAAIVASASTSQADDGCGQGWYWNGYQCAPMRYDRWHRDDRWRHHDRWRDHERWRHHERRSYDWRHHDDNGPRFYNDEPRYYPPDRHRWHTPNGCQPHYTVQDGLCKPYRGY